MKIFEFAKPKPVLKKSFDFKIFAAMCVHRYVEADAVSSMISLMLCPNPRVVFSRRIGDALIDRSRSIEATRFLMDKSYDVLLFLDDDIGYDPMEVVRMCRLVKDDGLDIVGATYSLKKERGHLTTKLLKSSPTVTLGVGGGVCEVAAVATGCMAIGRKVLEKIAETLPLCDGMGTQFYPFFQPFPRQIGSKTFYMSEDWALCTRARDLGFKIWMDCRMKLRHTGKAVYTWDDLARPPKIEHETFIYTEKFEEGEETPFIENLPAKAEALSGA